jgi:hypothetical protein
MFKFTRIKGAGATFLTVAIISGAAITTLGQRQYARLTTDTVWAAAHELSSGQVLQATDLRQVRVDSQQATLAINDARALLGRRLVAEKQAGEVIQQGDVAAPQRLGMTDVVPADRVVYTLTPDRQLLPFTRQLRVGDSFDILATAQGGRVSILASDVVLLGNLQEDSAPAPDSDTSASMIASITNATQQNSGNNGSNTLLVLAVKPEQVYPLASALGSNARISLVTHSRSANGNGDRLVVLPPPVRERRVEVITGLQRSFVTVQQDSNGARPVQPVTAQ